MCSLLLPDAEKTLTPSASTSINVCTIHVLQELLAFACYQKSLVVVSGRGPANRTEHVSWSSQFSRLSSRACSLSDLVKNRFPKIRGTFWGVPIRSTIVSGGLYWGLLFRGTTKGFVDPFDSTSNTVLNCSHNHCGQETSPNVSQSTKSQETDTLEGLGFRVATTQKGIPLFIGMVNLRKIP